MASYRYVSISQHPGRAKAGLASWVGIIDKDFRERGDKEKNFFRTKSETERWADVIEARCKNGARLGWENKQQEIEARALFNSVTPGEDVWDLLNAGRELRKMQSESISWLELCNQYVVAHKKMHPKYLTALRRLRDRYPQLHQVLACDLRPDHFTPILDWLTHKDNPMRGSRGGERARNSHLQIWHAILEFGIPRNRLKTNPIDLIERHPLTRLRPETFSNAAVQTILEYALVDYLDFVPYLVFGFFGGIRSDDELQEILWSDILFTGSTGMCLHVRAEVSKTGLERRVPITQNAQAWLKAYTLRGGPMVGRICPFTDDQTHYRQRTCAAVAGMAEWIHSGMRHTFCSNWLPVNGNNTFKLISITGHSAERMLKCYVDWIPEENAEKFWLIAPPPLPPPRIVPEDTHEEIWRPIADMDAGQEVSNQGRVCRLEKVNGCVKLLDSQVGEIRTALASGANQYQLAKQYSVSQSQISSISIGKRKELFSQYKDGRRILIARTPHGRADLIVKLYKNGKITYRPVHVLVAAAFLSPAPSPQYLIHHKDLWPQNNRASNLEWVPMGKLISFAKRRKAGYGSHAAIKRGETVVFGSNLRYWNGTETAEQSVSSAAGIKSSISA